MEEQRSDDSKRVGKKVKINAEIGIVGLVKAQIQYVKEHVTNSELAGYSGAATVGQSGAATAGNYGAASAGYYGTATAGDYGTATIKGKSAVGKNGLAVARGKNIKVKGGLGAVLVIVEENNYDFNLKEYKLAVVDGKEIKADTWYKLENGEFKEVAE